MISGAVAELGHQFRVSNALWIHLPRAAAIFDIIEKNRVMLKSYTQLLTHVDDKPDSKGMLMTLHNDWSKFGLEIPQETIRVLYHSKIRRVAACVQDRDGSTPY
ncbi:hypothetical protein TNCV_1911511 [Trichonephila clavipes]|nr:hypothetical protein TNCV_1911511 [Trichonephila clavipes]